MTTQTHQILFSRACNEQQVTAMYPVAPYVEGMVDLTEQWSGIWYWDDCRHVTDVKYDVRAIELPQWLSPEEWIRDLTDWKYVWGAGVQQAWPENWVRGFKKLPFEQRYLAAKLLSQKTFRSDFRKSLRDQIVSWLEEPKPTYQSPLSPRQWNVLAGPYGWREAKQAETTLYRTR